MSVFGQQEYDRHDPSTIYPELLPVSEAEGVSISDGAENSEHA